MTGKDELSREEIDAARRMMDAVNLHVQASRASGREEPGFVAIKLSDGSSTDGVLYDNRRDAVRHNIHDRAACYVKVGKMSMTFKEAVVVLLMNRKAYSNGVVFAEEAPQHLQLTELMKPYLGRSLRELGNG